MQQQIPYADAHTHLQDYEDYESIIKEAQNDGVQYIMNNSTSFLLHEQLRNRYPQIINSIGIHPWFMYEPIDYQQLISQLKADDKLQVGEIGLDFIKAKEKEQKLYQIEVFTRQMQIAIQYNRVISIHCVRASGDMLKVFKKILKNTTYTNSIIMHSYNCPKEITQSMDKLYPNFYYSFSMNIANKLDSLFDINKDKLLFETDAPHQYNSKVCESPNMQSHPKYLRQLVQMASEHLNTPNLAEIVFNNFKRAMKLL